MSDFYFLITPYNPMIFTTLRRLSCYQFVKDKNFESNSQLCGQVIIQRVVVISLSKIKISKAIHNFQCVSMFFSYVVISLSKIKISKAIHNLRRFLVWLQSVVISLSKIKISKAIHNCMAVVLSVEIVVISLSKIKISKAIHN